MKTLLILPLGISLLLGACASEKGGDVYSRDQVRQVQHFKVGTVEGTHKVRIEGTKSQVGTTAGGIAGSGAAEGRTGQVAAVLGAVVGGMVGSAAEEAYTRENGIEYTIKLEDGNYISVVQAANNKEEIKAGDKVRVIESDGVARVVKF
jgi:outer membrane lipoprotein SlyB